MPNSNLTKQDLKVAIKEVIEEAPDKDSFSTLTTGLTQNWVIIAAIITGVFWIFNSVSGIETTNLKQDNQMQTIINQQEINTKAISSLTDIVDDLDSNQSSIERDISEINNNIQEIKDSLRN